VVWSGIFGWYTELYRAVWQQQQPYLLVALVIVAGFTALYVWEYCDVPWHFFAVRRFTPVVIPGVVFFAACGAGWIYESLPGTPGLFVGTLALLNLAAHTAIVGRSIFFFTENKGYWAQLKDLAERLPEGELVLAPGTLLDVLSPLYLSFGRRVVPLDLGSPDGKQILESWMAARANEGRPTYLLCEESPELTAPEVERLWQVVLSRSYIEMTYFPIPRAIEKESRRIALYRIRGTKGALPTEARRLVAGILGSPDPLLPADRKESQP
jgi:hypothetical protein